jgi:hypothetical protein
MRLQQVWLHQLLKVFSFGVNNGVSPALYLDIIWFPILLEMPTNLIALSDSIILLQRLSRRSSASSINYAIVRVSNKHISNGNLISNFSLIQCIRLKTNFFPLIMYFKDMPSVKMEDPSRTRRETWKI